MGLFSGEKKTFVSSVVYNLAGDENKRVNYLKTVIVGNTLSTAGKSMGEVIPESYLNGPGMKLRTFARWAQSSGYNAAIGLTAGQINTGNSIHEPTLALEIPNQGKTVQLQQAEIGVADYTYWAEQYILDNYPASFNTTWVADLVNGIISIRIPDGTPDGMMVSFMPANYDVGSRYIYASYVLVGGPQTGPLVEGIPVSLGSSAAFPSRVGWTEALLNETDYSEPMTTEVATVVSYSDNRPDESSTITTSENVDFTLFEGRWERTDYKGGTSVGDKTYSLRQVMYQNQAMHTEFVETVEVGTEVIAGGVVKTTTATTTTQELVLDKSYRIDTQELIQQSWSTSKMFIYRGGSGNDTLDFMFRPPQSKGTFFPFIPLRVDNRYVSELWPTTIYPRAKAAFRKSMGARIDKVLKQINDNDSIDDIDFAYAVFGVSLNVKENACKRYIYEFFQKIMLGVGSDSTAYENWKVQWEAARASAVAWGEWKTAQWELVPEGTESPDPEEGIPEPAQIPYPPLPQWHVQINSASNVVMNYEMLVSWSGMNETTGSGLKKPGAKTGEFWFEAVGSDYFYQLLYMGGGDNDMGSMHDYLAYRVDRIRLHWQTGPNSWRTMELLGLNHTNNVYGGKTVETSAIEALMDTSESGFILPLHEDIFRALPLRDSTQMSTACCFLVFNCYQIVKQKWYQTSWFKVFLIIVIIVVTVMSGGAGAGSAGLLGTNAAVGATIGFVGAAAIVAGAIANAVAAMLVMQIVSVASTAIFGEKIGIIVTIIASAVAMNVGAGLSQGKTISTSFAGMMRADNIMQLASSFGDGVSKYLRLSSQETLAEIDSMVNAYAAESQKITELSQQNLSHSGVNMDPLAMTDVFSPTVESPDTFLTRTLMTGSDIAELSMDMLSNFAELTLTNKLPS